MDVLALLIVTVLGAGGPPGIKPPPMPQARVRVLRELGEGHPPVLVARGSTGPKGRFYARLRRGRYLIEVEREHRSCMVRFYSQTRGVGRVSLWCPVK